MVKRGARPKGKVKIKWSSDFAYAIGLIVTDGCLSNTGRHITLVSKDLEQVRNFSKALQIKGIKIGKTVGNYRKSWAYRLQFSDVLFYRFLNSIGIYKAKSKTIGQVRIPEKYFFDFLRGSFDGDGCFYSYFDKRWRSSFMFYIQFASASETHIHWIQNGLHNRLGVKGHISKQKDKSTYMLRYAKEESIKLLGKMYYSQSATCLSRKRLKIARALVV